MGPAVPRSQSSLNRARKAVGGSMSNQLCPQHPQVFRINHGCAWFCPECHRQKWNRALLETKWRCAEAETRNGNDAF